MRSASCEMRWRSSSACRRAFSYRISRIIVAGSGKRAEDAFELIEFIATQFGQVNGLNRTAVAAGVLALLDDEACQLRFAHGGRYRCAGLLFCDGDRPG